MYADPITLTVNAVAKVCPRVYTATGPSTFKMGDDEFKVEISHQNVKGRRERHLIRVTQRKIGADPLIPATNLESKMSAYLVLDNPVTGYSDTEQGYLISALAAFITNASNLSKFVGGEA